MMEDTNGKYYFKKKSILMLLIGVFLVLNLSIISAANFDNIQNVKETFGKAGYKDLEINNWLGLGNTLWSGTLNSNTETCGSSCSSTQTITLHEKGSLVDEVIFKTKQEDGSWNEQAIRSYQIQIKTGEQPYQVNDYETQCVNGNYIPINNSYEQICNEVKIGSHTEYNSIWEEYILGTEISIGTYEVKLTGNKKPSRTVDWIYVKDGGITGNIELSEWAIWGGGDILTESHDVTFTGASGSVLYLQGIQFQANNDLNIIGVNINPATSWTVKPTKCYFFNSSSTGYANGNTMNGTVVGDNCNLTSSVKISASETFSIVMGCTNIDDNCLGGTNYQQAGSNINRTNILFIGGSILQDGTVSYGANFHSIESIISGVDGGIITLNSPADNYISPLNEVQFNATATTGGGATLTNMSLWHNASGTWELNQSINLETHYENQSDGFDMTARGGQGITTNGSDFWVICGDDDDDVCHYDKNKNLIETIDLPSIFGSDILTGITTNGSDFWVIDLFGPDFLNPVIFHANSSWDNQTDSFILEDISQAQGITTNGSDFWISSQTMKFVFHYNSSGHNQTDGFDTSSQGIDSSRDIYTNNSDFWIIDSSNSYVYHLNSSGHNQTDGFDVSEFGIEFPFNGLGITGNRVNVSDFWISGSISNQDGFVNHLSQVLITSSSSTTQTFNSTFIEGTYLWGIEACDSDEDCGFSVNRTVSVDTSAPSITIISPTSSMGYGARGVNETINWTISDTNLDSCWFTYNNINTTLTCGDNNYSFTLEPDVYNLTLWANDSTGNVNSGFIEWVYNIFNNGETFSNQTYETASETYSINVTANSSLTAANLIWNGTSYAGTQSGDVWSRTIDIPLGGNVNKSFYWNFTYAGDQSSSSTNNISIGYTNLSICEGPGGSTAFINFTFKDEETLANINATADLATWNYWLGSGSVSKSYLFTNTSLNYDYSFCALPNQTLKNNLTFQYASTGYPQRIHVRSSSLNNITTNQVLYLLSSADGIYSTIQTTDIVGTTISGVSITVEREFSGVWTQIGKENTDASGLVTFWVNPDYSHRFTFVKAGYSVITTTLRPTQTTYTQIMSSGASAIYSGNLEGMRWIFSPGGGIKPTGITTFYWNITADLDNIDSCRFELVNSTRDVLNSTITGCGSGGGNLSLSYNLTENLRLWGRGYVDIGGGLFLVDGDAYWIGHDTNVSSTETLKYFFETLKDLNEFGEGVEQEFSKIVFFFLLLTILLGFLTFTTGWDMQNPGAIIMLLYPLVLFSSITGWFTFEGLIKPSILISATGAAYLDQYMFAFITGLFTFGFILNYWSRNS